MEAPKGGVNLRGKMPLPVHLLTAFVDEVVVGVSGVLGPLGSVVATVGVAVQLVNWEHEVVGEVRLQLLPDQLRRRLLLEPHWHAVSTA